MFQDQVLCWAICVLPQKLYPNCQKSSSEQKKREQKSLSLAESLRFLHEVYQPLSIFIDQNPASTKDMT